MFLLSDSVSITVLLNLPFIILPSHFIIFSCLPFLCSLYVLFLWPLTGEGSIVLQWRRRASHNMLYWAPLREVTLSSPSIGLQHAMFRKFSMLPLFGANSFGWLGTEINSIQRVQQSRFNVFMMTEAELASETLCLYIRTRGDTRHIYICIHPWYTYTVYVTSEPAFRLKHCFCCFFVLPWKIIFFFIMLVNLLYPL